MAWIPLNIHRATEAMVRAAVFYCVVTLPHTARPALFQRLAYYILKTCLLSLIMWDKEMRTTIKKRIGN